MTQLERNKLLVAEMRSGGPNSEAARTALINLNMGFVHDTARKISPHGMDLEDMITEGSIGLITAIDRIKKDPSINSFSSYVCRTIYFAILMAVSRKGNDLTLSDHICRKIGKLRSAQHCLTRDLHRHPTQDELSDYMKISFEEISKLFLAVEPGIPLFSLMLNEDDADGSERVADDRNPTSDQLDTNIAMNEAMQAIYAGLTPDELFVITRKFGLMNQTEMTDREIAAELGQPLKAVLAIQESYSHKLRETELGASLRILVEAL